MTEVGYMRTAIQLEDAGDIRQAISCIHRNVRNRLRENQIAELDNDLREFDVEAAGIETILSVLVATAVAKKQLPSRKRLFRQCKKRIKGLGEITRGILDGLK